MNDIAGNRDVALQMTRDIRDLAHKLALSVHPDLRNRAAQIEAIATWMLYDAPGGDETAEPSLS